MILDIVLDTNIFLHADNPCEERQGNARGLLIALRASDTNLCVDEGYSVKESANCSRIWSEYLRHLRFGMLGYAVVAHLASSARVREVPGSVPGAIGKRISRCVKSRQDRVFAKVAFNSDEKILASHDFVDIPQRSRDELLGSIGVSVLCAQEALHRFD